jgi:GNAT superfamily N-acetyltransferase
MSDTADPQPLATGWEAGAPASDTLLRAFLLNMGAFSTELGAAMGGQTLRRDDLRACDLGRPAGLANNAILLQPLGAGLQDDLLTILDDFFGFGRDDRSGEVVLISAWPTPDLRPRGWTLMGHPPLHLLPAGATAPAPPAELRFEQVQDEAALREWEAVAVAGYPMPDLEPVLPGALYDERVLGDERLRLWVGRWEGKPIAVSGAFVADGINDVVFVATLPEARGRGYGAALTWQAALTEPGLPAMLLSSEPGRPLYDRMGFLPLFRFTLWVRGR